MTITPSIGGPVPRFFFDTNDGNQSIFDKVGLELEGLEAAKAVAQATLVDMVRDALPVDDRQAFIVSVMDEAGQVVVRTTLSLVSEYPNQSSRIASRNAYGSIHGTEFLPDPRPSTCCLTRGNH